MVRQHSGDPAGFMCGYPLCLPGLVEVQIWTGYVKRKLVFRAIKPEIATTTSGTGPFMDFRPRAFQYFYLWRSQTFKLAVANRSFPRPLERAIAIYIARVERSQIGFCQGLRDSFLPAGFFQQNAPILCPPRHFFQKKPNIFQRHINRPIIETTLGSISCCFTLEVGPHRIR